jgi:hypothetical protein
MEKFSIIPVDCKIFILSGHAAAGKTHFANSISNAIIFDDVGVGIDTRYTIYYNDLRNTNYSNFISFIRTTLNTYYKSTYIIIYITNNDEVALFVKQIIDEWVSGMVDEDMKDGFSSEVKYE